MIRRILTYLQHQFYRRHRRGHGIHSPYLFEFLHDVVFNRAGMEVPESIVQLHERLKRDRSPIPAGNHGAGSMVDRAANRTVGSFVRRSSVSKKYGALLYRIVQWFRPGMIIELGTGLGISTLYLSAAATGIPLHTIEGNPVRAKFAGSMFMMNGMEHVQVHVGDLGRELDHLLQELKGTAGGGGARGGRFLAFVDGNHRFEPTIRYMRQLVDAAGEEAVIILDDIHWSREMHGAWMEVTGWPEVRVTIDLFHAGIILLRRDLHHACLRIKF